MIREYEFRVGISSISPANRQIVGMQTEKNATTVKFIVDEAVRSKMSTGILKRRFEAIDSLGNVDFGVLEEIVWESGAELYRTFEYKVSEALTRNGGNTEVYLIIACFNEEGENLYEWRSRPARLTFEGVENGGAAMDAERDSLSALSQQALSAVEDVKKEAETFNETINAEQEKLSETFEEINSAIEKAEGVMDEIEVADDLIDEKLKEAEGILQGVYNGISEVV